MSTQSTDTKNMYGNPWEQRPNFSTDQAIVAYNEKFMLILRFPKYVIGLNSLDLDF